MNDPFLKARLAPVLRRRRGLQLWCKLAVVWLATAAIGAGLIAWQRRFGGSSRLALPVLATLGALGAAGLVWRHRRTPPDWRRLATELEGRHPELDGRLLTAAQQPDESGVEPGYFRRRLVEESVDHSFRNRWEDLVPRSRLVTAQAAHLLALGLLGLVFWAWPRTVPRPRTVSPIVVFGVSVTPGDTNLERGSSLVVMARFGRPVPANADLVVTAADGSSQRLPLVKSLADPMFGGTVPEVTSDLTYRVEYGNERTRDFKIKVFEHPRLEHADADLTYPAYTALPPKRIADTRRVSAVAGTRLEWSLQLNKPVVSARLMPKDAAGAGLDLRVETNRPAATLSGFLLATNGTYELRLVDVEGRTNQIAPQFVINVLPNRAPELKLTSPRGDLRPSALEEVAFDGTVWDDFGVLAHGLAYTVAGEEPKFIELGKAVPAKEKRAFHYALHLEDLGVAPDQFLSWFAWADDIGPDGQTRRTASDLYFAEVRPFEEIFREGQGNDSQSADPQSSEQQDQPGNPSGRLAELQKQIISATWKLQRDRQEAGASVPLPEQYVKDATVVRDSQAHVIEQAQAARERAEDPRSATAWTEATAAMTRALTELERATNAPPALAPALAAEQSAYQALLKLQQREFEVARSRSRSRGQNANTSRQQQMQRQLDQLDLTQSENRYETERQAQAPATAERREQLQVLNRLQELARRQRDLNDRLQELQTALQEARTEQEREEARRQLKRLEEEQRQMLADTDELRQRMDRPENQSQMQEQRQQLDQARQDMQRAAQAAGQESVSQALAAGTRAQRQMEQMREAMRQQSAGEFGEELRQMRTDARELARQQEQVQQRLDDLSTNPRRTLSDSAERQAALAQLARQKARLTNLVDRATQISEQAEESEPLVSRELYDSLRKFAQGDADAVKDFQKDLLERGLMTRSLYDRLQQTAEQDRAKSLELTAEMLRQGYLPLAGQAQERARAGIDNLKRGVERAAERVLGDDAEALRLAQRQLQELADQLEREAAQAQAGATNGPALAAAGQARENTNRETPAGEAGNREPPPGARPGEAAQAQPGREPPGEGQPAQARNDNNPDQQGRPPGGAPRDRQGQALASTPADRQSSAANQTPGDRNQAGRARGARPLSDAPNRNPAGGEDLADEVLDRLFDTNEGRGGGPITGNDFGPWSDRLREVEEMVELPSLRSEIATARERAREMRLEFKRDQKKPDWAVVKLQVLRPLVEVRDQIAEELARRGPKDTLVPIDRDPVPPRFTELVRRYYEELGKDR